MLLTGVVLGAFAAHGLESKLSAEKLASFEVGVRYQMYHGIALLALAALLPHRDQGVQICYRFISWGVLLFSGSIYILALSELFMPNLGKYLWPVTPLGGVLLILAWGLLCWHQLKPNKSIES
ncbi:MAG: DUF423 domain-containing protein [Bacteroidetes bacterium]|nr:MAG: DUF423 domain-containing protein [Bacteroidota bacterium]